MSEKKAPTKRRSRATVKAEEGGDDSPGLPQPTTSASTSSRKRKAVNPLPRELLAPVTHMQDLNAAREERRSELVPVPHILERQRSRRAHSFHPSDPPFRRTPADLRSTRKPSVSNIAPRPPRSRRSSMPGPERNMLQHAWHTVMTTDPLVDSDEECHDSHVRTDYVKRMQVISRLRGRPPTPEGEEPAYATPMTGRPSHFEAHAGRLPSVF
ncbi:uncharacterized protein EDB91DRAFT_271327 [Suillus paluster]|uniref:uncharacterized protein n=1 Tax=Suillus paluster TaxID=48578 RepID=UPI001B875F9C|nr:uncharacterized protein EDB91DRAFT_271327 [Suillus paluster]KAG1755075.1 hypothetical protein EDB91DRAFT_271327 [Suillus paluster]